MNKRPHIYYEADVPLKLLCNNARTTTFEGTALMVQTDGSKEEETTAIGFIIYDVPGSEPVHHGDVDFGVTLNESCILFFRCYHCGDKGVEVCRRLHLLEK